MTVTSGSDTYKLYSGDGTTHVFAYTFRVFQNTELLVLIRNNTTGATYIASDAARSGSYDPDTHVGGEGLNTAYILSGVDDPNGGNVTFKYDTNNPSDENYSTTDYRPQTGESVIIIRVPAVSQETNYVPGGAFPAESHEDALDKLTFHVQRIEDQLNKTIQRPEADTGAVGSSIDSSLSVLPDNEDMKGKYLSFNATTGAPEAGATATDVVLSSSAQTLTNKSINADNNSISNLEVDNFKDSAVVTESEGIATFDNDTTLPTSAAVKNYVDSQVSAVPVSDILSITAGTGLTGGGSAGDVELSIDSTVVTLSGTGTLTNKTIDASQLTGTIDDARIPAATTTSPGLLSAADKTKLNGIDANATDDQTAAEIRALVDSASDSNVFTDADKVRLEGIEAGADVTDTANVVAALTAGTNVTIAGDGTISATDTDTQYSEATTSTSGLMSAADKTKLDGVETGATADQTAAEILTEIKTVDGAASGLDADLLDGQEGSYYTGYTDSAVANLVDSAPATLDTLNELAAALGDDANFSTTVTNSIATKLPLAGGTMTGNIVMSGTETVDGRDLSVDGAKLDGIEALADVTDATNVNAAGAAIFSTTPTANITDGTSGQVLTTNGSGGLSFTTVSGGGGISNVVEDTTPQLGGVLDTNGNNIEFPDSTGIEVNRLKFGSPSDDLQIYHDTNHSYVRDTGTGALRLTGSNVQMWNSAVTELMLKAIENGAVELYYDNAKKLETTADGIDIISTDDGSSVGPSLHLYRNSASPADFDDIGSLYFSGNDSGGNKQEYAYIRGDMFDVTDGTEDGATRFYTTVNGSAVEHMQHSFGTTAVYGRLYLAGGGLYSNPHLRFEGSTNNDFETEVYAADPTADRTITLPDATGEVVLKDSSDVVTITSTENDGPVINLVSDDPADATNFGKESAIRFTAENSASEATDYAEIYLATGDITDGTEDGWIYFRTMHDGSLTNTAAVSPMDFYLLQDNSKIVWSQWGGTSHNITLTPSTPTAARTITLPDATGTVALTSDINTANVTAAGALMDSEVTNLADVKSFDPADYATAAQGTTADAAMPKAGGTFTGDVTFTGANYNVVWDKSDSALELADNAYIKVGAGDDMTIRSDGTYPRIKANNIIVESNNADQVLYFRSNDTGDIADFDIGTQFYFQQYNDNNEIVTYNRLLSISTDVTDGSEDGRFQFQSLKNGANTTSLIVDASYLLIMNDQALGWYTYNGDFSTYLSPLTPTADRSIRLPDRDGVVQVVDRQVMTSNLAVGWHTIAVFQGRDDSGDANQRFHAKFTLLEFTSSRHQAFTFYAQSMFGQDEGLQVIGNSTFGIDVVTAIRIKSSTDANGLYAGAAIQVYVADATNSLILYLDEADFDGNENGVTYGNVILKTGVADASDPGDVGYSTATWSTFAEDVQIGIDSIEPGGIGVTGNLLTQSNIVLEGATADAHETIITATDATADRTITLPDATGTVALQNQTINAQTGTTYTTVLSDAAQLVTLNNASAITLTIPPNSSVAYPTGTRIDFIQIGAGQVTVAGGTGVTVNSTPTLKFRAQHSAASCIKIATDTWQLVGDLAES